MTSVAQTWPILTKPKKREKRKAQPSSACGIQEDQQNSLGRFKVCRRLPPHPPSETVRPGAVKGPGADPKRKHKANNHN